MSDRSQILPSVSIGSLELSITPLTYKWSAQLKYLPTSSFQSPPLPHSIFLQPSHHHPLYHFHSAIFHFHSLLIFLSSPLIFPFPYTFTWKQKLLVSKKPFCFLSSHLSTSTFSFSFPFLLPLPHSNKATHLIAMKLIGFWSQGIKYLVVAHSICRGYGPHSRGSRRSVVWGGWFDWGWWMWGRFTL